MIENITDPEQKVRICKDILHALPEWFAVEESVADYARQAREMPFYVAFDAEKPVGFLAVKPHNAFTAEICVMGVLQDYHRQGVGAALVRQAERFCQDTGREFLTVKTLDASAHYAPYDQTRSFYRKMGFTPLEVFPLLWDEDNPCLFLAKHLACMHS